MPTLLQRTIDDVCAGLPSWRPLEGTALEGTAIVCAAGFEERAASVFVQWAQQNRGSEAVCIVYPTNRQENEQTLTRFGEVAAEHDIRLVRVLYERRAFLSNISAELAKLERRRGLLVDISAMASFVLYPTLDSILSSSDQRTLHITYTEAEVYYPDRGEWTEFWKKVQNCDLVERAEVLDKTYFQSRGEEDVFESPSFIGTNPDTLPGVLIMIPNFSFHRIFHMVEHVHHQFGIAKGETFWVLGCPPDHDVNGWRRDAIYDLVNRPANSIDCSTLEYKDVMIKMQTLWEKYIGTRVLYVATLGSKAQHLGVFLFLKMHPEISLTLSEPTEFVANRFSHGVGPQWIAAFGTNLVLAEELRYWNRLVFSW